MQLSEKGKEALEFLKELECLPTDDKAIEIGDALRMTLEQQIAMRELFDEFGTKKFPLSEMLQAIEDISQYPFIKRLIFTWFYLGQLRLQIENSEEFQDISFQVQRIVSQAKSTERDFQIALIFKDTNEKIPFISCLTKEGACKKTSPLQTIIDYTKKIRSFLHGKTVQKSDK